MTGCARRAIIASLIKDQRSLPFEVVSAEDGVYRALRAEIGRLELAPGLRLPLEELAARFDVSATPVRHALRRLESDGLVVIARRRGARVAPLSLEELEEIQALRLGLETFLARHGAEQCTDAALGEMVQARAEMEQAFERGDLRAYIASLCYLMFSC